VGAVKNMCCISSRPSVQNVFGSEKRLPR